MQSGHDKNQRKLQGLPKLKRCVKHAANSMICAAFICFTPVINAESNSVSQEERKSQDVIQYSDQDTSQSQALRNFYEQRKDAGSLDSSHYLEMIAALIMVLALIIGLAWVLRRTNLPAIQGSGKIKIESSLALGSKEKLFIVNVENKRMLLGSTSTQITLLQHLEESPSFVERNKDFGGKLKSLIRKESQ